MINSRIEVLISTMNLKSQSVVSKQCKGYSLVINQSHDNNLVEGDTRCKIITVHERGLSKSRNLAIKNSYAEICCISDNDCYYLDNYQETVLDAYDLYPEADVILFDYVQNRDNRKVVKRRYNRIKYLNQFSILKFCSVNITFRSRSLKDKQISFNEHFGAGSEFFSSGEELLFLKQCLVKGLRILYIPVPILELRPEESTWFKGFNRNYFITLGAFSKAIWGKFWQMYLFQFIVRHAIKIKHDITLLEALKYGFEGKSKYDKILKNNSK